MTANHSTSPFVGVQIAAHSILDEGIDYCLDLLAREGAVNTLLISSHTYYGAMGRPAHLQGDHGKPLRDNSKRNLPRVWVRHHDRYFGDTAIRHPQPDAGVEYAGRDLFEELAEPSRRRGMKVYVRFYEGWAKIRAELIENWDRALSVDMHGRRHFLPCWNNPEFGEFWLATIEDLVRNNPIDGIQYGAERAGPLRHTLYGQTEATCFCEHCRRRAEAHGIDMGRARNGFLQLEKSTETVRQGAATPTDGTWVMLMRLFFEYPEMLAWEQQDFEAKHELTKLMAAKAKAARPEVQFGVHISDAAARYPIERAIHDYGNMAELGDFLKLILYHDIGGARLHRFTNRLSTTILKELTSTQTLGTLYAMMGLDAPVEPPFDRLAKDGLSPQYVYRETRRCVEDVRGKAQVYAGIGLDIPKGGGWGTDKWTSDPQEVYQATATAFEAGAHGVVASREYEEITLRSLRALGRAVRDAS